MKLNTANIYNLSQSDFSNEIIENIAEYGEQRIERIISLGHATPEGQWYDQDQDEFVLLLQGEAKLTFVDQDKQIHLKSGDYLIIPAHNKHRVDWTLPDSHTIWLTFFISNT